MNKVFLKKKSIKPINNSMLSSSFHPWLNHDNKDFYEELTVEGITTLAQKSGLANGCDVKLLQTYYSNAQSILEVGAGHGRVIQHLIKNNCKGKITAIERCNTFFAHLNSLYADKVTLIQIDLHDVSDINERFDVILWLWSGIADFSPLEQLMVLGQLKSLLTKGGSLIFDTLPATTLPLGMKQKETKTVYCQEISGTIIYTYSLLPEEIDQFAKLLSFSNVEHLPYITDTGRERLLHILS